MTELELKAVKKSLVYNRKYSEDRNLEDVLKHPEKYVDSYAYTMNIVQMLRQKAYRDGYNVGAKENEQEKCELLGIIQQKDELIKKMKCCENCKHQYYENGINYCNNRCRENLYNNWELKGL